MGSSVRKTSEKIKKLLKETIELNPSVDCKDVVPQVAEQTLRSRKTKGYFGDKDFVVLAGGGFSCFKKAAAMGIDNFLNEYEIQSEKLTVMDTQKIIDSILDKIEEDKGDIDSPMILAAFQTAMTEMLLNKISDPVKFLLSFCEIFITMVIREDASEELSAAFKDTDIAIVDKNIKEFANAYVEKNFLALIQQCNNEEIQIEELIQKMQATLGKNKE
jgi:hypothetical protein